MAMRSWGQTEAKLKKGSPSRFERLGLLRFCSAKIAVVNRMGIGKATIRI
jgi:hypothetical protein